MQERDDVFDELPGDLVKDPNLHEIDVTETLMNIAFARGGAHSPIAHALRLLSTQELRFGLTKLNLRKKRKDKKKNFLKFNFVNINRNSLVDSRRSACAMGK